MLGSLVVQRADMTARPDPKAGAERLRFIEIRPYSLALVPFIAAVAAAGISQAGATGLSDEDRSAIDRLLGEDVLGPALPADPVGEKTTLIPLAPSTRIFRLSSGPDAGTTEADILRASAQEGSDATWQYAAGRRSIYHLRSTGDGSIVIPSERDLCSAHLSGTTHHSL